MPLGKKYSAREKKKIIDFVKSHNDKNGRGGMAKAVKHFKISFQTLRTWLKGSGTQKAPSRKTTVSSGSLRATVTASMNRIEKYSQTIARLKQLIEKEKAAIQKALD